MITNSKPIIWGITLLFSVASLLVISSCSDSEDDPGLPPTLSYPATTVEVGSTGTITPAVQGDADTYAITDADGADSFVSISSSTGVITVSASSAEGVYNVVVTATNNAGTDDATAVITIVEPVIPPGLAYQVATVEVGKAGTIAAAVTGDAATYSITKMVDSLDNELTGDAIFVSVDANSGELSVAEGSTIGGYMVTVKASNSGGEVEAIADLTISVNADFNPVGKSFVWKYWINQDEPWTLSGLDGIPGLPIQSVEIPTGWPPDWPAGNPDWNEQYLFPFLALGGVQDLLLQVPSDIACEALDPEEGGDTLRFKVEDDLTLSAICTLNDAAGSTVTIGSWNMSYANGGFVLTFVFQSQIEVTYVIADAAYETFVDPLDETNPGRQFTAIRGMVDQWLTPTNVFDEGGILTSLTVKKVEIILEELP